MSSTRKTMTLGCLEAACKSAATVRRTNADATSERIVRDIGETWGEKDGSDNKTKPRGPISSGHRGVVSTRRVAKNSFRFTPPYSDTARRNRLRRKTFAG